MLLQNTKFRCLFSSSSGGFRRRRRPSNDDGNNFERIWLNSIKSKLPEKTERGERLFSIYSVCFHCTAVSTEEQRWYRSAQKRR